MSPKAHPVQLPAAPARDAVSLATRQGKTTEDAFRCLDQPKGGTVSILWIILIVLLVLLLLGGFGYARR